MERKNILTLSEAEWALFQNKEFMPVKAKVLRKLEIILSQLMHELEVLCRNPEVSLPVEVFQKPPKISRGENYHNYAYRVMDYPRYASGEDLFLFRCVILWGHPIGFHLILQGRFKEQFETSFLQNFTKFTYPYYLSDQKIPWIWEADDPGYLPIISLDKEKIKSILEDHHFLKLSLFSPLDSYAQIPEQGTACWEEFCNILFNITSPH